MAAGAARGAGDAVRLAAALARPAAGRQGRCCCCSLALALFVGGIDHIDYPALRGFNIAGGVQVVPELVALWAGLTIYAAAFIAEIVRAAILSVHKGQREAALSLGLGRARCCRRSSCRRRCASWCRR